MLAEARVAGVEGGQGSAAYPPAHSWNAAGAELGLRLQWWPTAPSQKLQALFWTATCYWMTRWWNLRWEEVSQEKPKAHVLLSCCEWPWCSLPLFCIECHWDPWNGASSCCRSWVSQMWYLALPYCNVIKQVNWTYFYEYEPIYR